MFTYELGDRLITDTDYYVEANEYALSVSNIDFSQVNTEKTGSYPVQIKRAFQLIDIQIEIVDTTPPDLVLFEEDIYLEVGKPYESDKFVSSVNDLSGAVTLELSLENENNYENNITAAAMGELALQTMAAVGQPNSFA